MTIIYQITNTFRKQFNNISELLEILFQMQKPGKTFEDEPSSRSRPKRQQSIPEYKNKKKYLEKVDKKKKLREESHKLTQQIGQYTVQLENPLGKGTYGQVYIAYVTQKPEQIYACKHISNRLFQKQKIYESKNGKSGIQERLQSEIDTLKRLSDCKYVVKFHDLIKDSEKGYYLFMEKCDNHLGNLLEKGKWLEEQSALNFFKQLLKGYKYLYDQGISHRDLKPQNLLIKEGKYLKLSDFGFVKIHTSAELVLRSAQKGVCLAQSLVGSINYMAPDIIEAENQNKQYDPYKSDVWSMGIILHKMLYGKEPYHAQKVQQLLEKIKKDPLSLPEQPNVSIKIKNLLKSMIQPDAEKRISFKQVYNLFISPQEDKQQFKDNGIKYTEAEKKLKFYNLLITKLSYDSAHHATLRQIGITDYQKFTYKLMTYIHQKRLAILQSVQKQVSLSIKKEIKSYQEIFYEPIKQTFQLNDQASNENGELNKSEIKNNVKLLKKSIKQYKQREMLYQKIQYFMLLLLLFCNLERNRISFDYIFTIIENDEKMNLKKLEQLFQVNLREKNDE